jgi:arsenite methyltransferase
VTIMSCCSRTPAPLPAPDDGEALRTAVRDHYARAATGASGCCHDDPITRDLYPEEVAGEVGADPLAASLGCGNPTALASLAPGEVVLDLGSGAGLDVLLSARRVGPTGFAYGVDMTDEMLARARRNQERAGVTNVAFLKGTIEAVPLPDSSVDVIISNCVINLAADKREVLREAFRLLRPGGRFAVADVVTEGPLPEEIRRDMAQWSGCIGGALTLDEYQAALGGAGFEEVEIEITRRYDPAELLGDAGSATGNEVRVASAFVRAVRPRT